MKEKERERESCVSRNGDKRSSDETKIRERGQLISRNPMFCTRVNFSSFSQQTDGHRFASRRGECLAEESGDRQRPICESVNSLNRIKGVEVGASIFCAPAAEPY